MLHRFAPLLSLLLAVAVSVSVMALTGLLDAPVVDAPAPATTHVAGR